MSTYRQTVDREDGTATTSGGLRRVTSARRQSGRCLACGRRFSNLGAAAAHVRSTRHVVEATYSAKYVYLPPDGEGVGT